MILEFASGFRAPELPAQRRWGHEASLTIMTRGGGRLDDDAVPVAAREASRHRGSGA